MHSYHDCHPVKKRTAGTAGAEQNDGKQPACGMSERGVTHQKQPRHIRTVCCSEKVCDRAVLHSDVHCIRMLERFKKDVALQMVQAWQSAD